MIRLVVNILVVLTVVLLPVVSLAQGNGNQYGQLNRELDRTDDIIEQAREAVTSSNSALGALALQRAVTLQESAWSEYGQGQGHYASSLILTKKAREQASVAISNSRMADQLDGVVNSRLERAQDQLERVRESLDGAVSNGITNAYDQAKTNLVQAWEFYRKGQIRAAAKLVEQLEQSIQRLQNMVRAYNQSSQEFELRYENVLRMVEQAKEAVVDCESQLAREQMTRAEESLSNARRLFGDNHPVMAVVSLNAAREAARRASRECLGPGRLDERLKRLEAEAEHLKGLLEGVPADSSAAALELMSQAREQLRLARKYLGEDKDEPAIVALQAANLALRQARRYIPGTN